MKSKNANQLLRHVKESYAKIAHEFSDTRHHGWKEFDLFKPYLTDDAEIVDLGCGNGRLLKFIYQHYYNNNFRYIGIDNSENLLKHAKQIHPEGVFVTGDQLDIPLADNHADVIFNIAAFHHIPGKKLQLEALLEMKRALKKKGLIILTVWNLWQRKYWKEIAKAFWKSITTGGNYSFNDFFIPWKNKDGKVLTNRYYHAFLPSELLKLFKQANLEIVESMNVRKGEKVPFRNSFNICIIARKHD